MRSNLGGFLLAMSACTASASGAPLLWTLTDVAFNDGGTASGSFEFDASNGQFSNINMVTAAAALLLGQTYQTVLSGFPSDTNQLFLASAGTTSLTLNTPVFRMTTGTMTGAGGVLNVGGLEGFCADGNCDSFNGLIHGVTPARQVISGTIVSATDSSGTPEPSTILLLAVGGMVIAAMQKSRMGKRSWK